MRTDKKIKDISIDIVSEQEIMKYNMKLAKQMKLPFGTLSRVLSSIEGGHNNPWPIIGVTKKALERFKEFNFLSKTPKGIKLGINRCHLRDRVVTHKELVEGNLLDKENGEWFDYWREGDKTVLAVSSENKNGYVIPEEDIIPIERTGKLFVASSFSWRHTKQEQEYLKNLYEMVMKDK
jgi:hypothetical protein